MKDHALMTAVLGACRAPLAGLSLATRRGKARMTAKPEGVRADRSFLAGWIRLAGVAAIPILYPDMGARFGETAPIPRAMAKFYRAYQDRLLYGTDMGVDAGMYRTTFRILETEDEHFDAMDLFNYHWPLHGFGLPDAVLKKVYGDNAQRMLHPARRTAP